MQWLQAAGVAVLIVALIVGLIAAPLWYREFKIAERELERRDPDNRGDDPII
jgi:membrane protein YdbS with pleckstrin-like domain